MFGQVPFVELGVEGRADHLGDSSGLGRGGHVAKSLVVECLGRTG